MASRRHPAGPPPSTGVLAKYVQAYAREAGLSEGRVRGWISYMVMAGALERAAASGQPRFTVKGGIALELRLRNRARATKDIDVVLQHVDADLARTLEGALSGEAYQGFTLRLNSPSVTSAVHGPPSPLISRAPNRARRRSNGCRPFRSRTRSASPGLSTFRACLCASTSHRNCTA